MTNTDFKTKWVRRTSKARAKAPDANDVLRGGGPGALRGKQDEARVVSLAGLRPDAHHAGEDEAHGDTVAAVINASNEQNGRHHSPVWWQDVITADRLQHEVYEPIRFVVPDLIPAKGVTLLCSKPKIGKSWLVLDLCIGCTTTVSSSARSSPCSDSGRGQHVISSNQHDPEAITLGVVAEGVNMAYT
jgi:AAA domain